MTSEVHAPAAPASALGRLPRALARIAAAQGLEQADLDAVTTVHAGAGGDGQELVDRAVDAGSRLVVLCGEDAPTALVVIASLLDLEPVAALGTAPGPGWAEALVAVRSGLVATRAHVGDPRRLREVAGEPALLTDALVQAAVRRTPVLLDASSQSAAALLLADRLAPGSAAWCTAAAAPSRPGAAAALRDLDLEPLLDDGLLDSHLGAGAAELALVLLRAALTRA